MIKGIFETHINVSNLEHSIAFYGDTLGLTLTRYEENRRVAFFWVGESHNEYMLGVWEKPIEQIQRQHFAFRVDLEDIHSAKQYLLDHNLTPRNFLNEQSQDPMVFAWMPAIAIYFSDPDEHSLEFIAPLDGEPRPNLGILTWDEWQNLN